MRANGAAKLGSQGLTALGRDPLLGVLEFDVRLGEIEDATIGVIQRRGKVGAEFPLEHHAHSARVQSVAAISETYLSRSRAAGTRPQRSPSPVPINAVLSTRSLNTADLHTVLADVPGDTQFLVMSALQPGRKVSHADARIGFAEIRGR